jgi:hypothetical protein
MCTHYNKHFYELINCHYIEVAPQFSIVFQSSQVNQLHKAPRIASGLLAYFIIICPK